MKRGIWLACVALILVSTAIAQEANVFLSLRDINTNEAIDDVSIEVTVNGQTVSQYVKDEEVLRLRLDKNVYTAEFVVDDISTPGKDYYGKKELFVEESFIDSVFLFPVGSLRGTVKDKLDNVIDNADLKFDCVPSFPIDFPENADKFGSFSLEYVPVGSCKVFAGFRDAVGVEEIVIEQGSLTDIEIKLDQSVISEGVKSYHF